MLNRIWEVPFSAERIVAMTIPLKNQIITNLIPPVRRFLAPVLSYGLISLGKVKTMSFTEVSRMITFLAHLGMIFSGVKGRKRPNGGIPLTPVIRFPMKVQLQDTLLPNILIRIPTVIPLGTRRELLLEVDLMKLLLMRLLSTTKQSIAQVSYMAVTVKIFWLILKRLNFLTKCIA